MSRLFTPGYSEFTMIHGAGVAAGFTPPDSSSIYFGRWNIFDPSTSYVTHAVEVDRAMTLVAVHCTVIIVTNSGNPASNVTLRIRVNNTTSTTIGSATAWNTPGITYTDTSINSGAGVALAAGDDFVFEFVTPNWTTQNPGPCYVSLIATFKRP